MMSDGALVDSSPIVVEAKVLAVNAFPESASSTTRLAVTDYRVEVLEVLKGSLGTESIIVRVPGARRPAGLSLHIWGAPVFSRSERALLFLFPRADGTYGINQLGLGAFHLREERSSSETKTWAVRDLSDAQVMALDGTVLDGTERARDYDGFRRWMVDRQTGTSRLADYMVDLPQWRLNTLVDFFTLFERNGLNFRWQNFDNGLSADFFAHEDGQPDLDGGGFDEIERALAIWTADPRTHIDYRYGGTTDKTGGLTDPCDFDPGPDGVCTLTDPQVNSIIFDDPNQNSQIFGSPFRCPGGGVLAAGGPWFNTSNVHEYRGKDHITIVSADVVTNKGAGCFLNVGENAEEVFAHELGHTLGLGHSCGDTGSGPCDTTIKDDALMRASAHGGNRGGVLGEDDQAGAAALYTPPDQIGCIPGDTTLCLTGERFKTEVEFMAPGGAMTSARGVDFSAIAGNFWFLTADNPEVTVKVLDHCRVSGFYWVFVGGLTDFNVVVTVTDTEAEEVWQVSSPSDEPLGTVLATKAFETCP